MDVTFFEDQLFYPKPAIQGENQAANHEYQFWDCYPNHSTHPVLLPTNPSLLHSPQISYGPPPNHNPGPSSPKSYIQNNSNPKTTQQKTKELPVYSRKQKKNSKEPEDCTLLKQRQEAELSSLPLTSHTGITPLNSYSPDLINDLD